MDDGVQAITDLEALRAQAIVANDLDTLARITADDYVHVESSGRVRDKAGFLETLRSGNGRFERYELTENLIRLDGDTAVVTGAFENAWRGLDGTLSEKRARHARVYVRRGGLWLNILHQATALPMSEGAGSLYSR